MSSEQVIAEREHYKALSALSDTDKLGMLRALRGDLIHEDDRWQWCPALDWAIDRLSTPAADYECRAHACRRVRVEMEARNAEQAAIIDGTGDARGTVWYEKWKQASEGAARLLDRLTALLDGIEGLEKDLLGADWLTDSTEIAHDLKALREKANGSQGVVPSTRPWPGKCIK